MRTILRIMVLAALIGQGAFAAEKTPAGRAGPRQYGLGYNVYFGDLHSHSAYSNDAWQIQKFLLHQTPVEPAGSIASARARGLDFMALTDHAEQLNYQNLIYGQYGDEWANTQTQGNAGNAADMVVFLGYEFTKTGAVKDEDENLVPLPGAGHKCVIFRGTSVPETPLGANTTNTPLDLWASLVGYEAMTIPHHPARGEAPAAGELQEWEEYDMSTDWSYVPSDPSLMPVVEVFSVHGSSDYGISGDLCPDPVPGFRTDRSVELALMNWLSTGNPAYKLGLVGGTDDHTSRPGNCTTDGPDVIVAAEGEYSGGMAVVLATGRTRAEIFDAIVARRCYATSGPKINLDFSAWPVGNPGGAVIMGQTLTVARGATVHLSAAAGPGPGNTVAIDRLVVTTTDGTLIPARTSYDGTSLDIEFAVLRPQYVRVTAYQETTQRYDTETSSWVDTEERAWSSPIWIEIADDSLLAVTSPNGGQTWDLGSSHDITWTATGLERVKIELLRGGTNPQLIATDVAATPGVLAWVVPGTLTPAGDYSLRISALDVGVSAVDESDQVFALRSNTPQLALSHSRLNFAKVGTAITSAQTLRIRNAAAAR